MIYNSNNHFKQCWNCGINFCSTELSGHYCKDCIADFKNGIPLTNAYKLKQTSTSTYSNEYLKKKDN